MPRRIVDLESFRPTIEALVQQGLSYPAITEELRKVGGIQLHWRTVADKCRAWGITRRQTRTSSPEIVAIIIDRFQRSFDSDIEISKALAEHGIEVSADQVKFIRQEHHLLRRPALGSDLEVHQAQANEQVSAALETGVVRQYGIRMTQAALRVEGVRVSRYEAFTPNR